METRIEGANLPFIDILIFAVIAVLLVLRLRSVLGQRTGYEEPRENQAKEGVVDKQKAKIPFPKAVDKPVRGTLRMDKARQSLGFYPKWSIEEGYKKYCEWYVREWEKVVRTNA